MSGIPAALIALSWLANEMLKKEKSMNIRWTGKRGGSDPVMVRWETKAAEFIQIEVSPSHILRIRIDKVKNK